MMYDVIVIGGGIVGSALLRELSHTNLKALLLEKCDDVACGCSRANSGIVHAGYDAEPGTKKAKFNVLGNAMYFELAKEMHVPCQRIGSLVLAEESGYAGLETLLERGKKNGVPDLRIVGRDELVQMEPNVGDNVQYALYAPTAGIVSPYEMTIAMAEQAVLNGAEVRCSETVQGISFCNGKFEVKTQNAVYQSSYVVNCAGYGAAEINAMAGEKPLSQEYKRGDYFILDSVERSRFHHVCFPLPTKAGKGILVSPTADGNVIVGPTSVPVEKGDDTAVKADGLNRIREDVGKMMKNVNFGKGIRVFAGVRTSVGKDFVVENGKNKAFLIAAGICSPGLTAAPAIAKYLVDELLPQAGASVERKKKYVVREAMPVTRNLSKEEWAALIRKNPAYSRMVCRCEKITEGEILDALDSPLHPRSVDALKRRVRTGMGRCQGGFCTPKIMEIIHEHCGLSLEEITKEGKGSEIVVGDIKEGNYAD